MDQRVLRVQSDFGNTAYAKAANNTADASGSHTPNGSRRGRSVSALNLSHSSDSGDSAAVCTEERAAHAPGLSSASVCTHDASTCALASDSRALSVKKSQSSADGFGVSGRPRSHSDVRLYGERSAAVNEVLAARKSSASLRR
jgi:hypothetical protein